MRKVDIDQAKTNLSQLWRPRNQREIRGARLSGDAVAQLVRLRKRRGIKLRIEGASKMDSLTSARSGKLEYCTCGGRIVRAL